jgi:putative endonuclease
MFKVYVLYSSFFDKIYIGYTADLPARLTSHNELGHKGWTIHYRPWVLVYTEEFEHKSDAMKREKQLKTGKGRAFVWELVKKKF